MSWSLLVGWDGSSESALESQATRRPSMLRAGEKLSLSPWVPLVAVMRVVVPATMSRTKTSEQGAALQPVFPLVSLSTRFEESDQKATYRPSALMVESAPTASPLVLAWVPSVRMLACLMAPVARFFT